MAKVVPGYPFSEYVSAGPALSQEAKELADAFILVVKRRSLPKEFCVKYGLTEKQAEVEAFVRSVDATSIHKPLAPSAMDDLLVELKKIFEGNPEAEGIARYVSVEVHGYRLLQPLFDDFELEEIMVNGVRKPVMVVHRAHGICRSDLAFSTDKEYREFIMQVCGSTVSYYYDGRLVDGSRVNVMLPPSVVEPVVTVRKFRKEQLSLIDLIANRTVTPELAAFLWVCVDGFNVYPLNILIIGGPASGKTSTLKAIAAFIPPSERVITVEDTREINLGSCENWVALEASEKISLDDLLKNTLRMRPDRILVGEVRGAEAITLFTAMNVGQRGMIGTMHAYTGREAVRRLENAPMTVPRALIPLLNVLIVQQKIPTSSGAFVRRIMEVSEVSKMEDQIALNEIFKWNDETGEIARTEMPITMLERLSKATGQPITALSEELDNRARILEYLRERNVTSQQDVNTFLSKYYAEAFGRKVKGS
ncbi:CpaF family protein [Candidatus Micrarchaeota archaeon]|nr:CpaF family protein [Candidatus Micrarchaeota archaeon]